jgi:hypothetical protein
MAKIYSQSPLALKKLSLKDRNKVRSIITAKDDSKALDLLNKIRRNSHWKEVLQIERALRSSDSRVQIPDLFPRSPETEENYYRLVSLPLHSILSITNSLAHENINKLNQFCSSLSILNREMVSGNFEKSFEIFQEMYSDFGYSHLLLRKAAIIKIGFGDRETPELDEILDISTAKGGGVVRTTLVHCYKEEPDFLAVKRSVLNLAKKGSANRFTRDLSRLPLHPHAKDEDDFSKFIQSCLQSSLVDACLLIKINATKIPFDTCELDAIERVSSMLESASPSLDEISEMYLRKDAAEEIFIKRSSAWFESSQIVEMRFALDHFNDSPDASYLDITEDVILRAGRWLRDLQPKNLLDKSRLTYHACENLSVFESEGRITRSAAFNFGLWNSEGYYAVGEQDLFDLMGRTEDLSKTSPTTYLRNLAATNSAESVKLIAYLLIAKRSRSEKDDHRLRHIIQKSAIQNFGGSLVDLISAISKQSDVVAEYAYEICTEDFIAKLSRITKSAAQITETRAALHQWMGEKTGKKVYLDRARTTLIDHQISRVRNEIDDNRIYVDSARFREWVNDDLVTELNSLYGSLKHGPQAGAVVATQLVSLIFQGYSEFCQNQVFGIASYLGRRIRHGTFKGHLYYSVISAIESQEDFRFVSQDSAFQSNWMAWKKQFESSVDEIIRERLHVETATKRFGFLRINFEAPEKYEISFQCAKNIVQEYSETGSAEIAAAVLLDYCWRLAEVDLKIFNGWLKGQKNNLLNVGYLDELKGSVPYHHRWVISSLHREIIRSVQEKLNVMSSWFKRPSSVSPKASLSLLFRAVVAEVQETFPSFMPIVDEVIDDIDLFGGAYHVLYDSFYVAVFNAAKHGKEGGQVGRKFSLETGPNGAKTVVCEIFSELKEGDAEFEVNGRLQMMPNELEDISSAQIFEGRSGIKKLHQLAISDEHFRIRDISARNGKVWLTIAYSLGL